MKQFLLFLFLCLSITACKKKFCCGPNSFGSRHVDIILVNEEGERILDMREDLVGDSVKVYYKNGSAYELASQEDSAYPNRYRLFKEDSIGSVIRIFVSDEYEWNMSETLIEYNRNTVDTLCCRFNFNDGVGSIDQLWYNGELKPLSYFEVVK